MSALIFIQPALGVERPHTPSRKTDIVGGHVEAALLLPDEEARASSQATRQVFAQVLNRAFVNHRMPTLPVEAQMYPDVRSHVQPKRPRRPARGRLLPRHVYDT